MSPDRFDEIFTDFNHFEELYPELSINNNQYYDIEKCNDIFSVNESVVNDLSVIHVNMRSLNGNDLNVFLSLLDIKFDIVCVSETRVNEGDCIDNSSRCDRRG